MNLRASTSFRLPFLPHTHSLPHTRFCTRFFHLSFASSLTHTLSLYLSRTRNLAYTANHVRGLSVRVPVSACALQSINIEICIVDTRCENICVRFPCDSLSHVLFELFSSRVPPSRVSPCFPASAVGASVSECLCQCVWLQKANE